jgi:CotH kinase protein
MDSKKQQAMDRLYAIDNVPTVKITMSPADWDAVRTEQPAGGICNFDWTGGSRYTWRKAASVEISGTNFPATTTFTEVGVKKKSFCGSINSDKPCLHIDFGRFSDATSSAAEDLIGTRYLTLNNSVQDPSYVRQPLAYTLLGMAGLPHSRCNFIRVFVNGKPVGQGFAGVNSPGVYVNAEPVMKRYIERNFNGNLGGNLYELEHGDDFVSARLPFISTESLSRFEDKADLKLADDQIAAHGLSAANQMLDLDQFIKVYAMEFLLKHWDGYSSNTNNTYVYNDVAAVASPGVGNVRFKLVPWGTDQVLQPQHRFKLSTNGLIAKLVRNDAGRRTQLIDQIRTYRDTLFGREVHQATVKPLLDRMEAMLVGFGVPNASSQIATVRQQLRLAASAGYLCAGLPETRAVYVLSGDTGDCLHASNTEGVPAGQPNPVNFEVYHRPPAGNDDPSDLWLVGTLGAGKSLTSQAFNRRLHASATLSTDQGHKLLYTSPADDNERAEEFSIAPVDTPDSFTFSGYVTLVSGRTTLGVTYGSDPTPGGRPRVYQDGGGSKLYFY